MDNKKAVKIGIISGIALLLAVGGIVIATSSPKTEPIKVASKSSQKAPTKSTSKDTTTETKAESKPSDDTVTSVVTETVEPDHSISDKEELGARQKEVEVNPDGDTGTDRRAPKTETSTAPVPEKDITVAGETGEHAQKVFDVKIKGTTVSEQDIANARKTLKDAGINDAAYSDLDIAKVIKAASDKSLDIATVARDGKF